MTTSAAPSTTALPLRRLYLVRFGFALVWAMLLFLTASSISPVSATLLVLYPVFDLAAAVVDARFSRTSTTEGSAGRSVAALYVNMAISALAGVGLVVALSAGLPAVLRVWGTWAVMAGIVQVVVAIRRRRMGGQWAMIVSGSISVLAGVSFVLMASATGVTLANLAGYALLGGLFFLASAVRLGRAGRGN